MTDNEKDCLLRTITILSNDRDRYMQQLTLAQAEGTKLVMELRELQKQLKEYENRRTSS